MYTYYEKPVRTRRAKYDRLKYFKRKHEGGKTLSRNEIGEYTKLMLRERRLSRDLFEMYVTTFLGVALVVGILIYLFD